MKIWIDGDACPRPVKQIVFRASERLGISVCVVANASLAVPASSLITAIRVPHGFDKADKYIAHEVGAHDLVITADIPLAAQIVAKGAVALDPRGELYTEDNVEQRLAMRNLMEELRNRELVRGGPAPFGAADRREFAAALDRLLTQRLKRGRSQTGR